MLLVMIRSTFFANCGIYMCANASWLCRICITMYTGFFALNLDIYSKGMEGMKHFKLSLLGSIFVEGVSLNIFQRYEKKNPL